MYSIFEVKSDEEDSASCRIHCGGVLYGKDHKEAAEVRRHGSCEEQVEQQAEGQSAESIRSLEGNSRKRGLVSRGKRLL